MCLLKRKVNVTYLLEMDPKKRLFQGVAIKLLFFIAIQLQGQLREYQFFFIWKEMLVLRVNFKLKQKRRTAIKLQTIIYLLVSSISNNLLRDQDQIFIVTSLEITQPIKLLRLTSADLRWCNPIVNYLQFWFWQEQFWKFPNPPGLTTNQ